MPIKSWTCPGCQRSFIVDAEAARDTCPWCNGTVEQKGESLQLVSEPAKPADQPAATSQSTPPGGNQTWWPFEYSS